MGSHLKHEHNINKYTVHVKRGMRCVFKPGKVRWESGVEAPQKRSGLFPSLSEFLDGLKGK